MENLPLCTKIENSSFTNLKNTKKWENYLQNHSLYEFEEALQVHLNTMYETIAIYCINKVSESETFLDKQRELAAELGLKKLSLRPVSLQLRTGKVIKVKNYYAKHINKEYEKDRHLSRLLWQCEGLKVTVFASITTLLSVICPSFKVAQSILLYLGFRVGLSKMRKTSLTFSKHCLAQRVSVQLEETESLAGKRVCIGIDGGRTRMREYIPITDNEKSTKSYKAAWREPKLFVITTIDQKGKTSKDRLPIYDCSFGDDKTFQLLSEYLAKLDIDKAKQVQFVGDGAPWIWNRAKAMLGNLGVKNENIIETLDHPHAMQHLYDISKYLPEKEKGLSFEQLKQALWEGNIVKMAYIVKEEIPDIDLANFTPFQYFVKQQYRIDYQGYSDKKLLCGSGIIESGIRRVINLRFKSPSAFWYPNNVEQLILMRCIVLAGRWNIMINNLIQRTS